MELAPQSPCLSRSVQLVSEGRGRMSLSICSSLPPPAAQTVHGSVSTSILHDLNHDRPGILP